MNRFLSAETTRVSSVCMCALFVVIPNPEIIFTYMIKAFLFFFVVGVLVILRRGE